jgi:hypothetical protein
MITQYYAQTAPCYRRLIDGAMRCIASPNLVSCDGSDCDRCDRAAVERLAIQKLREAQR